MYIIAAASHRSQPLTDATNEANHGAPQQYRRQSRERCSLSVHNPAIAIKIKGKIYSINPPAIANYSLKSLIKKRYLNSVGVTIKGVKTSDLDLTQKKQGLYC